ncbi:hypothetical protein [Planctomicrobium sp. SH527]|uniref:hypothetical protein n=1 Tax=Planctomicrobium sp. SH527 TaxID=3448123 RepID=UPI003F5AEE57
MRPRCGRHQRNAFAPSTLKSAGKSVFEDGVGREKAKQTRNDQSVTRFFIVRIEGWKSAVGRMANWNRIADFQGK